MSAKVSGPVSRVPKGIELGTRLQRNDLLAEIDPAPFRIEVAYRLALLARAKAERSRAEAVAKRQKALIGINQEKLRLARAEWSRLKGLFESKLTPEQEMERSELLVRRTQEDLQRAERALEEAEGQSAISVSNISAAEAELSRARQALSDTRLRAPFKGVISEKSVTVGEVVSPGTVLFRVVDHEVVRVQIRAPAADIRQVRSGLPASIRVEGFEKPFPGARGVHRPPCRHPHPHVSNRDPGRQPGRRTSASGDVRACHDSPQILSIGDPGASRRRDPSGERPLRICRRPLVRNGSQENPPDLQGVRLPPAGYGRPPCGRPPGHVGPASPERRCKKSASSKADRTGTGLPESNAAPVKAPRSFFSQEPRHRQPAHTVCRGCGSVDLRLHASGDLPRVFPGRRSTSRPATPGRPRKRSKSSSRPRSRRRWPNWTDWMS